MLDEYKNSQKIAYNILSNSLKKNKLSHAYLIETNGNQCGFNFALSFAKSLLCPLKKTNSLGCINCNQCQVIDDNNFIELEIIETEEMWIRKDKLIELQKKFNFKPIIGKYKVYIIKDADKIKESLANTLLKFIEEPAEGVVAILITENKNKILKTILSRCQIISLQKQNDNTNDINKMFETETVLSTIKFVNYVEKNGLETILNSKSLFLDIFKDRNDYEVAFNIILLYYKDALNFIIKKELSLFSHYKDSIQIILRNNDINHLLDKIEIVVNLKKLLKNNVNLNLILDKLIISLEKVKS